MEVPSVFLDFLPREEHSVPVGFNRDRNHKGDVPMTKSLLNRSVLLLVCATLVFGVCISPALAEEDQVAEKCETNKQCSAAPAETCTKNKEEGTAMLVVEQNARVALSVVEHGYVMENGRIVLDGAAANLRDNEDIKEFYLGLSDVGTRKSYREVKHYRRRKRWLG